MWANNETGVIYPVERIAQIARFAAKTMTGLPSILAGVFTYAAMVLTFGHYSAWAGGVAWAGATWVAAGAGGWVAAGG